MSSGLAVLHVAQPTDAGVAGYVAAVAADQFARGWRVIIACPDGGRLSTELTARDIPRLHWAAARVPNASTVPETQRLHRLVRTVRPDVVHLHSAKAGLAGRLALQYWQVQARHIVVRNGVDLARFTPADQPARAAERDQLGVGQNVPWRCASSATAARWPTPSRGG